MADAPKNMGASVRARLLTHSQATRQTFETVLTRYALERLAAKWLVRPCLEPQPAVSDAFPYPINRERLGIERHPIVIDVMGQDRFEHLKHAFGTRFAEGQKIQIARRP